VQIWLGLTNRTTTLHRSLGRVYASAVLIGSVGGFYLIQLRAMRTSSRRI
jgi:uncharacterized membrane protein